MINFDCTILEFDADFYYVSCPWSGRQICYYDEVVVVMKNFRTTISKAEHNTFRLFFFISQYIFVVIEIFNIEFRILPQHQ